MFRKEVLTLAVFAGLVGMLFASPVRAVDDLSLNVASGSETVAPGGTVTVTLDVANLSDPINGVQIRIQYNTSLMTLIDVVPNAGFNWTEVSQADNAGNVDWAATINGGSVSVDHTIATLTFTVIDEGVTSVTFRPDNDPFFTKLTRESDNGTILPNKSDSGTITLTCDDGLFCNGAETFDGVSCQPGTDPCDDGVVCTIDTCDEGTDTCTNTPDHNFCDDGNECTACFCDASDPGADSNGCVCTPVADGTACTADAIACTVDECIGGTCVHTPDDNFCDDGNECTICVCDASDPGADVNGCVCTPVTDGTGCTDDGIACTVDECIGGTCVHTPDHNFCDDGNECTACVCDASDPGADANGCVCTPVTDGTGCTDDGVVCTIDECIGGTCVHTPDDNFCDDGNECTVCVCDASDPGADANGCVCTPVADGTGCTDDGVACTVDECIGGTCVHTPDHNFCDDGNECTVCVCDSSDPGADANGCVCTPVIDGTACTDDGIACTVDECIGGTCVHTPDDNFCDDGNECTICICDANDPGADADGCVCTPVIDGTACSDDGVACTIDECISGTCTHTPDDSFCNDGLFCNGEETCDPILDCVPGTPPCAPEQFCNEVTDTCDQCEFDIDCDDNDVCTQDTCDNGACVYTDLYNPLVDCCDPITGTLTTIDDGDPCTIDTCHPDGSVTHDHDGQIDVSIKVQALSSAVTRDVTFVITNCSGGVDTRVVPMVFNSFGNGEATLTGVDAGSDWVSISEGHTLRRLASLSFSSCAASVDVSGANLLIAGDFHTATVPQDNLVDITDFSILASRWNQSIDPNASEGADVTGNGMQGSADFTAIQANFFLVGEAVDGCPVMSFGDLAGGRSGSLWIDEVQRVSRAADMPVMRSRIAVDRELFPETVDADLNGDGFVDARDIRLFAARHRIRLTPEFERTLRRIEQEERGKSGRR